MTDQVKQRNVTESMNELYQQVLSLIKKDIYTKEDCLNVLSGLAVNTAIIANIDRTYYHKAIDFWWNEYSEKVNAQKKAEIE